MSDSIPGDLITTVEAAALLRVHIVTCYRFVKRGHLRAWRLGGRLRVSRAEVLAMLEPIEARPGKTPKPPSPRRREVEKRKAAEFLDRLGV